MIVANKQEMYSLFKAGAFGGGPKAWVGLDAIREDFPTCFVIPRYAGEGGKDLPGYGERTSPEGYRVILDQWLSIGVDPTKIAANVAIGDEDLIIQGEVMRSTSHLDLRYSFLKCPMRVALATEQYHDSGLRAKLLLDLHLDPASREMLDGLLDGYDGAVIEFSCWSRVVTEDGRNTIFWEVRHY